MANSDGKFIRGLISNLVYREYRGKQIVQSKPYTPKKHRTIGTEKAATVFGKASKLAAEIRVALHHITSRFYDGKMSYRLTTEVLHCLNSVKDVETQMFNLKEDSFRSLAGFEFNLNSPVKNNLLVRPAITLDGTMLQIAIPDLKIPIELKFPENRLDHCKLIMMTTIIDFVHSRTYPPSVQIMNIPYSYKATVVPGQTFEFEVKPGCLCITAISLQYINATFAGNMIVNTKSFNPSAILHAFIAEGAAEAKDDEKWIPHSHLTTGLQ